jgi:hypothetical protein
VASCKQARQHGCSRAIEHVGVVEARGEVSEDPKERESAANKTETPESNDGASSQNSLSAE